jgi:hypothetical protein
MAQGIVQQDRRAVRAQGIIERSEVIPCDDLPGWWQVRDSISGSGSWHLATSSRCDCYDAGKGNVCKHQRAVRAEEQALRQFAADWDRRAEQQRNIVQISAQSESAGAAYKGQWYTAAQLEASAQARTDAELRCHTCGGHAEALSQYIGARVTVASHSARLIAAIRRGG